MRAGRLCGIFFGFDGAYAAAADTGHLVDFKRKVVPAAHPFVSKMIGAGVGAEALAEHLVGDEQQGGGQIAGVGGGAHLVVNHAQGVFFVSESQHRFDKIVAELAVQPGGADNDGVGAGAGQGALAFEFGPAIDRARRGRVLFAVGAARGAVEHVVGRNVQHADTVFGGRFAQNLGGQRIDALA